MENGGINYEGIQFYNNIIDELIQQNIQPWITMFHWDLPQWLQDNYNDGWLDRRTIDSFGNYARIVYTHFGDRVKHFITVNEPWT